MKLGGKIIGLQLQQPTSNAPLGHGAFELSHHRPWAVAERGQLGIRGNCSLTAAGGTIPAKQASLWGKEQEEKALLAGSWARLRSWSLEADLFFPHIKKKSVSFHQGCWGGVSRMNVGEQAEPGEELNKSSAWSHYIPTNVLSSTPLEFRWSLPPANLAFYVSWLDSHV